MIMQNQNAERDQEETEYLEKVYKFLQKRYSKKEGEKRNKYDNVMEVETDV